MVVAVDEAGAKLFWQPCDARLRLAFAGNVLIQITVAQALLP